MTPRAVMSRHAIESCTLQLHAWKPFHHLAPSIDPSPKPYPFHSKKPCLSDRSTTPDGGLDLSRLSLLDDQHPPPAPAAPTRRDDGVRWFHRKRRRRGSRSVSGRSSDRSCNILRGGASATYATCSDFPLATGGTDSSGELFVNGDGSWGSDVSEAARMTRREREMGGGGAGLDKDGSLFGFQNPLPESQGNESGYGSEPGYRGDGEFGYDDEFDEEDEDVRRLFWGEEIGAVANCEPPFYDDSCPSSARQSPGPSVQNTSQLLSVANLQQFWSLTISSGM